MTTRDWVNAIVQNVSAWDGIRPTPHRFGGTEFKWGKVEIGHVHAHGMVDIPFTRAIRAALVESGAALPHHLLHESGWITFYVRRADDVEQALRLYRLSYLHKTQRRAASRDEHYPAQVRALGFGAALNTAMGVDA